MCTKQNFNPRAPCGARPRWGRQRSASCGISIHAPRAGRDAHLSGRRSFWPNFNPRAPCGARLDAHRHLILHIEQFQSTRPVRGATGAPQLKVSRIRISIHAPRAGRDAISVLPQFLLRDFNPRAPCGARRLHPHKSLGIWNFNPRAPCGARP